MVIMVIIIIIIENNNVGRRVSPRMLVRFSEASQIQIIMGLGGNL
jgi:hypothetical protein